MLSTVKKRIPFGPLFQGLVADPDAKHYHRMKNSVWLYLYLIALSNLRSGKLIARLQDIAVDMGLPEDTLRSWLGHLKKWHYVDVAKQGDSLLFKIIKWQNISSELGTATVDASRPQSFQRTKRSQPVVQELFPSEDPDQLASYIANQLNDPSYQNTFAAICRLYPRTIIQKALTETKEVPREKIKKSRGALFLYLVKKYAHQKTSAIGN